MRDFKKRGKRTSDQMDNKRGRWQQSFVEHVKAAMGGLAIGEKIRKTGEVYHLRGDPAVYRVSFDTKSDDIGPGNAHFWKSYHN